MNILELLEKKRDGLELDRREIDYFIEQISRDAIPDYQAAAMLMAIAINGMTARETADLTRAMTFSGKTINLDSIPGPKIDKHSTGGVGDKVSLVLAPLAAAVGVKVPMISGRSLGHTGGTLDKLESIPGLSISQDMASFERIVSEIGISVIGQTADLVPADKKLYALRDVTGTVDNLSLIASSIMSKKIASGSDAIVLDVKTGSGAFMKTPGESAALARAMVEIGKGTGRRTMALVTDMEQPLGNAVGNALEVREAVEILRGEHPGDLREVSLALASWMVVLSGLAETPEEARDKLEAALSSGRGLEKLARMIEAQGGDPRVTEDVSRLPAARDIVAVTATEGGWIRSMDCQEIGIAALLLGAGRTKKSDVIDPAVGLWMKKRLGEPVKAGEVLAEFHVNSRERLEEAMARFRGAVKIGPEKPAPRPLIHQTVV